MEEKKRKADRAILRACVYVTKVREKVLRKAIASDVGQYSNIPVIELSRDDFAFDADSLSVDPTFAALCIRIMQFLWVIKLIDCVEN